MRIYISVDMEGIGGVFRRVQVQAGTPEYAEARQWAAEEIAEYIAGAREAGAVEFWVKDAHGSGANLPWRAFPDGVRLITGRTGRTRFPGFDSSFAAMFLVGYHARAGTPEAVLQHTWSSRDLTRFYINDRELGEIAFDATIAGTFGVPVGLVSGDDKTALEAQATLGAVETVIVKEALATEGACLYSPTDVLRRAHAGGRAAIERLRAGEFAPYRPQTPLRFRVESTTAEGHPESSCAEGMDVRAVLREVIGQS